MFVAQVLLIVCAIALFAWIFGGGKSETEAGGGRPCPGCGYDLRGGHDKCPECGRVAPPGEDEDAPGFCDDMFLAAVLQPRKPGTDERLVRACDTGSIVEAAFLTQLLENRGIIVLREGQSRPTDYQPVSMRLMVWSADADAAGALIAEVRRRQAERHGMTATQ